MVSDLSVTDVCCGVGGLLLIILLVFGGMFAIYDYLFFTQLEVYYGNESAVVPQDLEYFQIPIQYDPNSTVYATSIDMFSDRYINDTIVMNDNGFAIYTADIGNIEDDEIRYTFSTDNGKEKDFIIGKSNNTLECTVFDHKSDGDAYHYNVSPILK